MPAILYSLLSAMLVAGSLRGTVPLPLSMSWRFYSDFILIQFWSLFFMTT